MRKKYIYNVEQWNILKKALLEKQYSFYQNQHSWNEVEGFHAWFLKGDQRVEIITFS